MQGIMLLKYNLDNDLYSGARETVVLDDEFNAWNVENNINLLVCSLNAIVALSFVMLFMPKDCCLRCSPSCTGVRPSHVTLWKINVGSLVFVSCNCGIFFSSFLTPCPFFFNYQLVVLVAFSIHSTQANVAKIMMLIMAYKTMNVFLILESHPDGHCYEYPCYTTSNATRGGHCQLCDDFPFCPKHLQVVSICRTKPSEKFPHMCGMKLCHINDDCRIGGGPDRSYLGFPVKDPLW